MFALCAIALILYANALRNPFLIDDLDAIVSHPDVVEPGGILRLWGNDYWADRSPEDRNLYRPVVVASYWLNARITGINPPGFRMVNVILLAVLAWLTWQWLHGSLVRSPFKTEAWSVTGLSLMGAVLVLTHPVQATAVNNVIGRADLLAMFGVMGFAVLHQRAIARDRWGALDMVAAVLCILVAVGSKETGLLVVFVAIGQWWVGRYHWSLRPTRVAWIVLTPVAIFLIVRVMVVGVAPHYGPPLMDLTGNPLGGMSLTERAAPAVSIGGTYLGHLLMPRRQTSFIPDQLPTWGHAQTWFVLVWLTLTLWLMWRAVRQAHWATPMLLLAVGNYLMIGNLLTPIGVYAGHRLMIPFVLGFVVLVVMIAEILGYRRVLMVILGAVAAIGAVRVVQFNRDWRDHVTLMKANLDCQPDNTRAAFLYGMALGEQNRQREGIDYVERAVQRHPASRQARREYGKMLIVLGRFDEAIANYEALLRDHPRDAEAMNQLVGLQIVQGRHAQARQWLAQALALTPTDEAVMHNAAVLAAVTGEVNEAILRYEALLRQHPDHVQGRAEYDELRRQLSPQ